MRADRGRAEQSGAGADQDLRHRVVAGPSVLRRRVPATGHAGGPASARAAAGGARLDIAALLADALAALHEAGYLHGDVKPSNVGFAADGSPKLLDFGLVREANDATSGGGTARYLSPEVLSGRPAEDSRSEFANTGSGKQHQQDHQSGSRDRGHRLGTERDPYLHAITL